MSRTCARVCVCVRVSLPTSLQKPPEFHLAALGPRRTRVDVLGVRAGARHEPILLSCINVHTAEFIKFYRSTIGSPFDAGSCLRSTSPCFAPLRLRLPAVHGLHACTHPRRS